MHLACGLGFDILGFDCVFSCGSGFVYDTIMSIALKCSISFVGPKA